MSARTSVDEYLDRVLAGKELLTASDPAFALFDLRMKVPSWHVLGAVLGLREIDIATQEDWLRRGRSRKMQALDALPEYLRRTIYPMKDRTPKSLRLAAYRVEARRCFLAKVDEDATYLSILAAVTGATVALSLNVVAGVISAAFIAAVTLLYRSRARQKIAVAVEFKHWSDPIAWALYHPFQVASWGASSEGGSNRVG